MCNVIDLKQRPRVSVALVTWNRLSLVERAIRSAQEQTYVPYEIVVVDSASSDDTVTMIEREFPEVKLIHLHRNMGCPEGRNIAMANCVGDVIFSLDDDAWLEPNAIERCVKRFLAEQDLGIVSCNVLDPGDESLDGNDDYLTYCFRGGAFAILKEVLTKIGYFPSDYFMQGEETDLALGVLDSKYAIRHCPEIIVYHRRMREYIVGHSLYFGCRNDIHTVAKRYPVLLLPFGICWKMIVWNLAGYRYRSMSDTVSASLCSIISLPLYLSKRTPVSFRTIFRIIASRKKMQNLRRFE